jgi:hypothetical protein
MDYARSVLKGNRVASDPGPKRIVSEAGASPLEESNNEQELIKFSFERRPS